MHTLCSIATEGGAGVGAGAQMLTLRDWCPSTPPLVPAVVVHCVSEIESRGLLEQGIYRVPGSERLIKGALAPSIALLHFFSSEYFTLTCSYETNIHATC